MKMFKKVAWDEVLIKSIGFGLILFAMMHALSGCAPKRENTESQVTYVVAPMPTEIAAIIDPCGTAPNIYNEVFLKLYSGQLLASLSDSPSGTNTRFVLVKPGNYITTDGDSCYFTVDLNYNLINEHH